MGGTATNPQMAPTECGKAAHSLSLLDERHTTTPALELPPPAQCPAWAPGMFLSATYEPRLHPVKAAGAMRPNCGQ